MLSPPSSPSCDVMRRAPWPKVNTFLRRTKDSVSVPRRRAFVPWCRHPPRRRASNNMLVTMALKKQYWPLRLPARRSNHFKPQQRLWHEPCHYNQNNWWKSQPPVPQEAEITIALTYDVLAVSRDRAIKPASLHSETVSVYIHTYVRAHTATCSTVCGGGGADSQPGMQAILHPHRTGIHAMSHCTPLAQPKHHAAGLQLPPQCCL